MSAPGPRRSARWWVLRVLRGAVFIYAMVGLALFVLQRRLLFPTWAIKARPLPAGVERWALPVEGGEVEAFFLPAPTLPAPAVIYFHGNGECTDDWLGPMKRYQQAGASVLLVEFRGYNRSAGSPTREGLVEDALHFYDRLAADARVAPKRIVAHGRSMGGGVACEVAAARPIAALVLQSTYASLPALAHTRLMPGFLMLDRFESAQLLSKLEVPVLIAHGRRDSLIPFWHAQALAAAARRHVFIEYDADHNDCPPSWSEFMGQIESFLVTAKVLSPARAPSGAPPEGPG